MNPCFFFFFQHEFAWPGYTVPDSVSALGSQLPTASPVLFEPFCSSFVASFRSGNTCGMAESHSMSGMWLRAQSRVFVRSLLLSSRTFKSLARNASIQHTMSLGSAILIVSRAADTEFSSTLQQGGNVHVSCNDGEYDGVSVSVLLRCSGS